MDEVYYIIKRGQFLFCSQGVLGFVSLRVPDSYSVGNKKGKLVYKQYCVICHGADGKLAVSGASDLSISALTLDERVSQIKNGKGLMTPYKDILSQSQIQSVAEYLEELKK